MNSDILRTATQRFGELFRVAMSSTGSSATSSVSNSRHKCECYSLPIGTNEGSAEEELHTVCDVEVFSDAEFEIGLELSIWLHLV